MNVKKTKSSKKIVLKITMSMTKYIQNVPKQFPCSVPSAGNAQDIYSVPGHVIAMS